MNCGGPRVSARDHRLSIKLNDMTTNGDSGSKRRYKPNPMYAWIGQKRKAAARRIAEAERLTAEADALEADLRFLKEQEANQ